MTVITTRSTDVYLVNMRDKLEVVNHKTVQPEADLLQFSVADASDDTFTLATQGNQLTMSWLEMLDNPLGIGDHECRHSASSQCASFMANFNEQFDVRTQEDLINIHVANSVGNYEFWQLAYKENE